MNGPVVIIGGGIARPVTALALHKAGIASVIYEAHEGSAKGIRSWGSRSEPTGSRSGSFLTVATNGLDALRTLEADAAVTAGGFATPSTVLWSGSGKRLGQTALGLPADGGASSRTISRADLYRAVHDEARARGIRIEFGKQLVDARATSDGVRAVFADGSQVSGELLIGCDGVHSRVRRIVDPTAPAPTYSGLITLGGYVSGVSVETEPGVFNMIFGKRAFFGYVAAPDDEVWWFANVPWPDEPARGEIAAIDTAGWQRRLAELFAVDVGPASALIAATKHELVASAIHAIPHLPTWHTERMIVIGDAAHAPSPSSGQGASLAIEDAVVLAKCLRDLRITEQAFSNYEAQRRSRVERIIKYAARINSSKAASPIARVFRDALLPFILKLAANGNQTRWMFDYPIDWDKPTFAAA